MFKITEETQMFIDHMLGDQEELPREFEHFYDLKTKEELYKEMCMHRSTLEELEDMCDVHEVPYTNPLKNELNKIKESNAFCTLATVLLSVAFILELLFNHV